MIILPSRPSGQSLRAQAFRRDLNQGLEAGSQAFQSIQQAQDRTLRQQAMERALNDENLKMSLMLSEQSGQTVTPDQVRQMRETGDFTTMAGDGMGPPAPGGLSRLVGTIGNRNRERNQTEQEMKRQERMAQQEARKLDMDLKRQKLADMQKPASAQAEKLSSSEVRKVQEGQDIPVMLQDVENVLTQSQDIMGPIEGRLRSINPYDTRAQTMESQVKAASQAFGRFMEGGVLRKEDEEKYRRMFPDISDTPEVAQNKLAVVKRLLAQKQAGQVGALRQAGYDVSPFQQLEIPNIVNVGPRGSAQNVAPVNQSMQAEFSPNQGPLNSIMPSATAGQQIQLKQVPVDNLMRRREELLKKAGQK